MTAEDLHDPLTEGLFPDRRGDQAGSCDDTAPFPPVYPTPPAGVTPVSPFARRRGSLPLGSARAGLVALLGKSRIVSRFVSASIHRLSTRQRWISATVLALILLLMAVLGLSRHDHARTSSGTSAVPSTSPTRPGVSSPSTISPAPPPRAGPSEAVEAGPPPTAAATGSEPSSSRLCSATQSAGAVAETRQHHPDDESTPCTGHRRHSHHPSQ
jgi:hypothetical protein